MEKKFFFYVNNLLCIQESDPKNSIVTSGMLNYRQVAPRRLHRDAFALSISIRTTWSGVKQRIKANEGRKPRRGE